MNLANPRPNLAIKKSHPEGRPQTHESNDTIMINGFDAFEKRLSAMAEGAKELSNEKEIPYEELFTEDFLYDNTDFDDIRELLDMEGDIDENVREHSRFDSWQDMRLAAPQSVHGEKARVLTQLSQ